MQKFVTPLLIIVIFIGLGLFIWKSNEANTPTETDRQMPSATEGVKEFTMTAYYDPVLKKPIYSLPEMNVKKGDKVKVKITNTMGMHDFTLEEFNIGVELPLNQEVVVEFTADQAGEFIYYCAKPGHRQNGQLGTLKVTE